MIPLILLYYKLLAGEGYRWEDGGVERGVTEPDNRGDKIRWRSAHSALMATGIKRHTAHNVTQLSL